MRVERASVDRVKERLELLSRSVKEKDTTKATLSAAEEYEQRLSLQVAEEERLKRQRKEEAAARKKEREMGIPLVFSWY